MPVWLNAHNRVLVIRFSCEKDISYVMTIS
jgi:hypothetical protein